jgi:hypothetical protein
MHFFNIHCRWTYSLQDRSSSNRERFSIDEKSANWWGINTISASRCLLSLNQTQPPKDRDVELLCPAMPNLKGLASATVLWGEVLLCWFMLLAFCSGEVLGFGIVVIIAGGN